MLRYSVKLVMVIWEIPKGNHSTIQTNFIRVFFVFLRVSPLYIYACSLCVAGLLQLLIPVAITNPSMLMPLMLLTGFLQSAQEVLMPILCIKFAGTQNFTNAYGMLLLCQGISSLIGPPTLGKNRVKTSLIASFFSFTFSNTGYVADRSSYALTYFVIGIGTTLAALLLFTMPLVQKFYAFLTANSKQRKTNTLVTASNGDLLAPSTNNNSHHGTMLNINHE